MSEVNFNARQNEEDNNQNNYSPKTTNLNSEQNQQNQTFQQNSENGQLRDGVNRNINNGYYQSSSNYNSNYQNQQNNYQNNMPNQNRKPTRVAESKAGIGILASLFLGVIGLLIGYFCYKEKGLEYEWKTFLNGWLGTFVVTLIIGVMLWFALMSSYSQILNDLRHSFDSLY